MHVHVKSSAPIYLKEQLQLSNIGYAFGWVIIWKWKKKMRYYGCMDFSNFVDHFITQTHLCYRQRFLKTVKFLIF